MTPDAFSGLWRRRSVSVDGGPPVEPATVLWIQWGDRFLDLRVPHAARRELPLCGPGTFGGTTSWAKPVLTWHHELDSHSGGTTDAGTISWEGGGLVEHGVFEHNGCPVPYVEVWDRLSDPMPTEGRAWSPWARAFAVQVQSHRMAATVAAGGRWFAATSTRAPDGRWSLGVQVGDETLAGVLDDALLHGD